ncbi:hypothetical protein [Brevundimonas sp.]|uniref:hypothetical protein n=1 Tax=Brevundimonas sp. TaxID=1871086 RepID=UPI003AF81AE5
MTAVIIRKVESRLEKMVRPGGHGMKAHEALAGAEENLNSIEDICLKELDLRLAPIVAFLDYPADVRPSSESLAALIHHADRALTACGALTMPALGKTLLILSAMADALSQSDYWPQGALNPAINLISLFRVRDVPDKDAASLLSNLEMCLNQYVKHIKNSATAG